MTEVKHGEWYFGAKCPECGDMAAHTADPERGQGDGKVATDSPKVTLTCPKGHRFEARGENMISFEWGAQ